MYSSESVLNEAAEIQSGRRAGRSRPCRLAERAERIEEALAEEVWLPIGLRSLMASEFPRVRSDLKKGRRSRARRNVHRLALMSFGYGPKLWDSEAVSQLRVLDLELNPSEGFEPERRR